VKVHCTGHIQNSIEKKKVKTRYTYTTYSYLVSNKQHASLNEGSALPRPGCFLVPKRFRRTSSKCLFIYNLRFMCLFTSSKLTSDDTLSVYRTVVWRGRRPRLPSIVSEILETQTQTQVLLELFRCLKSLLPSILPRGRSPPWMIMIPFSASRSLMRCLTK